MARTARIKSSSGVYHIIIRGVNKQTVFYDDEDKEEFLSRIELIKEKHGFELYAFCFMSNHMHILLKEKEVSISKIMQKILTSYVFWYNSKYERVGNLFQDRYKSEAIENNAYLLCAVRFIHQNPIKAGLVQSVSEYKWSSNNAYLTDNQSMVDTSLILSLLQGEGEYIKFMETPEDKVFLEPFDRIRISDNKLLKEIVKKFDLSEIKELYLLDRNQRKRIIKAILEIEGSNPYQISRVIGVPMGIIRTALT